MRAWRERVVEAVAARNATGRELPIEVSWGRAAAAARGSLDDEALADADRGLYGDKAEGLSAIG